jgi:hypothetical protein
MNRFECSLSALKWVTDITEKKEYSKLFLFLDACTIVPLYYSNAKISSFTKLLPCHNIKINSLGLTILQFSLVSSIFWLMWALAFEEDKITR